MHDDMLFGWHLALNRLNVRHEPPWEVEILKNMAYVPLILSHKS